MTTGAHEELERIGRVLPPETVAELSRLTSMVSPETVTAIVHTIRLVPADVLEGLALPPATMVATPVPASLEWAVLQRAMRAVAASLDGFDQEAMSRIAAEETDAEVLFDLLCSASLAKTLEEKDPLAEARLRGVEEQRRLVAEAGGTASAAEAAEILGVSRQAVDARRKKGRLLAVGNPGGRRGLRYPLIQFDAASEDGVLRGLERVLAALEDEDGWMALAFLLSPEERLGDKRPVDLLKGGSLEDVTAVHEAALLYGEHGAY